MAEQNSRLPHRGEGLVGRFRAGGADARRGGQSDLPGGQETSALGQTDNDWANPLDHRRDQYVFKVISYGELNNGAVMLPHFWAPGDNMTGDNLERTPLADENPFL